MTRIITITNLGPDNKGQISAADLTAEERNRVIEDVSKPIYAQKDYTISLCRWPDSGGGLQNKGSLSTI